MLKAQINNIKYFNPSSEVVIYNGGKNKSFARALNVPICPYSRPLKWGYLPFFLWDVMRWLSEQGYDYEYLVNLDHDVLFFKRGYASYLDETMDGYMYMGWDLKRGDGPVPTKGDGCKAIPAMDREWHIWQPFFNTDHFLWAFNPGQVFRKEAVTLLMNAIDSYELEFLLNTHPVRALEEMLLPTMIMARGGQCRSYPIDHLAEQLVRWGKPIRRIEVKKANKNPLYYWMHPIKGNKLLLMQKWLMNRSKKRLKKVRRSRKQKTKVLKRKR